MAAGAGAPGTEHRERPVCPTVRRCVPSFGCVAESLPHQGFQGRFGPLSEESRGERKSRINAGVTGGASGRSQLPAVRAVTGVLGCIKSGVKNRQRGSRLRSQSPTPTAITKKQGSRPGKEQFMAKREICFLSHPEKKAILERRYQEGRKPEYDRFRRAGGGLVPGLPQRQRRRLFLPTSIKSYLDGRLGQLEERLSSWPSGRRWSRDMVDGILADAYQFSDEDLRRRRRRASTT